MKAFSTALALAGMIGSIGVSLAGDPPRGGNPSGEILDFAGDPPRGGNPSGEILDFA